ncbi:forkhead box protein G1-like [Anopheles darlingi]|uniref:forkhead box protein G1-like n=1 Tax=Anopheles darlingi TaxID=43151 RepID=UPI00210049FA|nr:forkhead box protein G1-like [Anopheles darlingi]
MDSQPRPVRQFDNYLSKLQSLCSSQPTTGSAEQLVGSHKEQHHPYQHLHPAPHQHHPHPLQHPHQQPPHLGHHLVEDQHLQPQPRYHPHHFSPHNIGGQPPASSASSPPPPPPPPPPSLPPSSALPPQSVIHHYQAQPHLHLYDMNGPMYGNLGPSPDVRSLYDSLKLPGVTGNDVYGALPLATTI